MRRGTGATSFDEAFPDLILRSFRLAYRILGDHGAVEDVAADALAIALVRWHRVADLPHRDGWVLRTASNLALKALRKSQRHDRVAPPAVTSAADFEHDTTLRLALVAALAALPKRQRETIVLRYLGAMDEATVAATLGVSTGTVKTHVHRGLQHLRESLGVDLREEHLAVARD